MHKMLARCVAESRSAATLLCSKRHGGLPTLDQPLLGTKLGSCQAASDSASSRSQSVFRSGGKRFKSIDWSVFSSEKSFNFSGTCSKGAQLMPPTKVYEPLLDRSEMETQNECCG